MECVAFETKTVLEELGKNGAEVKKLKMVGGAAKSALWTELTGYITGCEIELPLEADGCCLGAAMIALVGLRVYPDYETAAEKMVKYKKPELKNAGLRGFYEEKYKKYIAYSGFINKRFDIK
jgi:xylulokinase